MGDLWIPPRDPKRTALLVGAALVVLVVAALAIIDGFEDMSDGGKRLMKKALISSAGLALGALFGAVVILSAPAWVGVALTVGVLAATGGYAILSNTVGLPELPQGSQGGGSSGDIPCGAVDPATGTVHLCL